MTSEEKIARLEAVNAELVAACEAALGTITALVEAVAANPRHNPAALTPAELLKRHLAALIAHVKGDSNG